MNDSISRQDAIETALTFFVEYFGGAFREDDQLMLKKKMEELPSVQTRETKCEKCYWSDEKGCSIFCRAWNRYTAHGGYCHQYADMRSEAREYLEYGKLIAKGIEQGLKGDSNEN